MDSVEKALYSETSCLAHTCFNSRNLRPHLVYFHLPKSEKLCEIWLKNAGRLDLLQMPLDVVKKNYFLCEEHFEDKWFRKVQFKGSLNYFLNPVPTIFVNNYKMFSSKIVEEEYENKKKREEFMRTLPDFDEMHVICDEYDDSATDLDIKITNCKVPSDQYELKETEIEITTEINKENDIPIISNFENLNDCVVIKETIRQNFCRFCTEKLDGTGIYIFSDNKTSENIKKMINIVLPKQVHENDGLPHHICFICVDKITYCYDFITKFYSAEVIFRNSEFNDNLSSNNDELVLDSKDTLSEAEEKIFLTTM
uniref:Uncharacterized protein n=1 Tax=Clastoptera arizonana TaxID=38151 RepID=A0A1B6ECT7_9HEMI